MREESKEVLVEDLEKTEREAKGMNVSRKKKTGPCWICYTFLQRGQRR